MRRKNKPRVATRQQAAAGSVSRDSEGTVTVPSSSPWHKQAGCPCSLCGRKHYSLERKSNSVNVQERDGGGGGAVYGCVERWGLEILTGFHSRPGNSTSPLMKARPEQSM